MKLRNSTYEELANYIRADKKRAVVYGAGMIGQIVVPYVVETYGLQDYIECYVDMDSRKVGKSVTIGDHRYEIRHPDFLDQVTDSPVILLTNSKFFPVVDYLDKKESLKDADCYIIPIMQKQVESGEFSFPDNKENVAKIPKIIHYCWFGGGEIPAFLKECMNSWMEQCPDYEIKHWDETNFDVSKYLFTKQAYEHGRYGFVSDVARLDVLYRYGGIFMDTDVRLIRPLDVLLSNKGFVGTERWGNINSGGGIGAVPHHPMIKEMLDYRAGFSFAYDDGTLNIETNGLYETTPFIRHGYKVDNSLQIVNDMTVLPSSVFHPYDYMSCEEKIEDHTIGIHYFYGGWMDEADRKNRSNTQEKYKSVLDRIEKCSMQEQR